MNITHFIAVESTKYGVCGEEVVKKENYTTNIPEVTCHECKEITDNLYLMANDIDEDVYEGKQEIDPYFDGSISNRDQEVYWGLK